MKIYRIIVGVLITLALFFVWLSNDLENTKRIKITIGLILALVVVLLKKTNNTPVL